MRRWPAIALAWLLVSGCGTTLVGQAFRPESYTVRRGDTIYSIAWRYGIDHQALMRWNDIAEPRNIQVGRRLRLHPANGAVPASAASEVPAPQRDSAARERRDRAGGAASGAGESGSQAATGPGPEEWRWPTDGEVVGTFANGAVAGRGIDISGRAGQPIHAAAPGEVVYGGVGLKGYGRLLIIRHSGDYLSAYAHNRELLVGEGDRVDAGQRIARMGESLEGRPLLHFEIRRGGSPVDPKAYLPPR